MEDLSLHILDIAQNSIDSNSKHIEISIEEYLLHDRLTFTIKDDGKGMGGKVVKELMDPFFTTKGKKVGLGIPLLAQSAREAGGDISVISEERKGTTIIATFCLSHIDRRPIGDITSTLLTLIAGHSDIDFIFNYRTDKDEYRLSTAEIKKEINEVPINYPVVLALLREDISSGIKKVR